MSTKGKHRAATTRLTAGQHSIDRATPRWSDRAGAYVVDWSVRLHDGKLIEKRSQGQTKGKARLAARQTAQRLLTVSGDSEWSPGDMITDYITQTVPGRIRASKLSDNTVDRYAIVTRLLAGECDQGHKHRETLRGYSIRDAARTKRLTAVLQDLAATHGPETAHQARSVLSRYVLDPLCDYEEIIDANPIRGRVIDLNGEHRGNGGARDTATALSVDQYWQVVDYLLARGDQAPPGGTPRQHAARQSRYSPVKWAAARDLILLAAGTGLRASEATALRWEDVTDDGETMIVPVSPRRSKTGRGRRAAVVVETAEHLRQRHVDRPDDAYVIAAPADGSKQWDARARDKAVAAIYVEMADALGIELLRHDMRSHGWRHSLNTITADSVPVEIRSALLGHDERTNRDHYLDDSDLTAVARAVSRRRGLRAVS